MLSIVIPFKYDSENRLENILEISKYIKKNWFFDDLFVVEMDDSPKIINLLPSWSNYIFVKEKQNEVWSRSKRINMAVPMVKSQILMILDSDVVVDWNHVDYIINKIKDNELDAATPFENLYHMSRDVVLSEMKKNKIEVASFIKNNEKDISRIFKVNGACFITRVSIFKHIRGMNELFLGWGLEDDELIERYNKLGFRYGRSNGSAIHINHERTASCSPEPNYFFGSITEKNRIKLMSKMEILNYYGIKEEIGIYNTLSVPMGPDKEELLKASEEERSLYLNMEKKEYKI